MCVLVCFDYLFLTLSTERNTLIESSRIDHNSSGVAISVQLMELIAEKKGCDLAVFKDIRSELDKMASGGVSGVKRPMSGGGSDVKKPRLE